MAKGNCAICRRPDAQAINAALLDAARKAAAGEKAEGLRSIAARHKGVSVTTLHEHRNACLDRGTPPPATATADRTRSETFANIPNASPPPPRPRNGTAPYGAITRAGEEATGSAAPLHGYAEQAILARNPHAATTFALRVWFVARLMAEGEWYDSLSRDPLMTLWEISLGEAKAITRSAACLLVGDRGDIEQQREVTKARFLGLHLEAKAAGDYKAAAASLEGYRRCAGIEAPKASVTVNVMQGAGMAGLAQSLLAFVDARWGAAARSDLEAYLTAVGAGDEVAYADPARWLESWKRGEAVVIDTSPETP
jgi:hypothetical protein